MAQAESKISMADIDNSQVGFPRFHDQNEMSPPPQEKMTNLEATMVEWRRIQAELAKSRTEVFMEETNANVQFQSIPLKSLEETMTPKAASHTQAVIEIEQPTRMKDMSIEEIMAQHMNEE